MKSNADSHGRILELDGLRGIAVLMVMAAHFGAGVSPTSRPLSWLIPWDGGGGGLVGVQLFFVLSGFLITSLLLAEHRQYHSIRLRAFYERRFRRLMPALVVLCAVYGILAVVFGSGGPGATGTIVHAITYTGNLPYGIPLADNAWLRHTWSLAVEEQFYLVWPALFIAMLAWRGRRGVAWLAALGMVVTIALRHLLPVFVQWERLDFLQYNMLRWDALMLGCLLALTSVPPIPVFLKGIAFGAILLMLGWMPEPIPPWAYTASTLACGVLVVEATRMPWLRRPVLVHIGLISYSLYLWHILVLRYGLPSPISLVITVAVSELSYRLVEVPFRRWIFPRSSLRIPAMTPPAEAPKPLT